MKTDFTPLNIAILTISDTRDGSTDTSGDLLEKMASDDGHNIFARALVKDDLTAIQQQVKMWCDDDKVQVIVSTGGTGLSKRDVTPEAIAPMFDKEIVGFGELFRQLSYDGIGTSTIQSRALGGIISGTLVFALPGSNGACRDGWQKILHEQLDNRHKPCNFHEILGNL